MDQISRTVNTFLSYIVGIGLICFFSFVFLLASARLNKSTLGSLLASSAGETARMARSESFSFWGDVGQQVAGGLGVSTALGGGTAVTYPIITPAGPAATAVPGPTTPPPTAGPSPVPPPTSLPVPTNYISSSPLSEGGKLRWLGLEADGTLSPLGVSLESVRDQANLALSQNSGDLLALWLLKQWRTCEPYLTSMRANYADLTQVNTVRQGADDVLTKCNPRIYEAYARKRWADLQAWGSTPNPDETRVKDLLAGLKIFVGAKVDGPARGNRPEDHVPVTFQSPGFGLPGDKTITVTIGIIDQMLGNLSDKAWDFNSGPYLVTGVLFPVNPAEPILPTVNDLTPPVVAPAEKLVQPAAAGTPTAPGKYVVAAGDTVYGIARKFNVAVDALIAANPNTLGFNPNYITPGMELNIPGNTP
jgi:hypothetical protein